MFLKGFFEKVNFEKVSRPQMNHKKQHVKVISNRDTLSMGCDQDFLYF